MSLLALLVGLLVGSGEGQRPAAPAMGEVMRFDWSDSAGRAAMYYRLKAVGRGLRYLDIGTGYETWTVVDAADADSDLAE